MCYSIVHIRIIYVLLGPMNNRGRCNEEILFSLGIRLPDIKIINWHEN